ncbi:TorF family putative porin [Roseomonas sp. GC11]|uniref:TorF family putative porin n=1 Tax=Roseomonas sp. GC11 TaxID=2950546 RepID=UPI00210EB6A1|nr:TorF family putative porin [Roseomonas sp. GC11]MCQ4162583.1 TorF family putative porin [Roseomonas sp. GC11]
MRRLAPAFCAVLLAAAPAAQAFEVESAGLTVTATPAITSDYVSRGISQTRGRPAVQGTLDIQHESGAYVGAFLSNAQFLGSPWNDSRQELDLLAGYRFSLGGLNLDAGYIAYLYPGQDKAPGTQIGEYQELALKASYTLEPAKFLASVYYSPNFAGRSGSAYYLEGGADVTLPLAFTASARMGYQWVDRNTAFGTPDYLSYSLGLSREVYAGVTASLGWYGTDISKKDCSPAAGRADGGQKVCDNRVVLTLSRSF